MNEKVYNFNPKLCKQCGNIIPYIKRQNKFCCQSCAASFNNSNPLRPRKYGPSKKNNLTRWEKIKLKRNIEGPYSPLYRCSCRVCNKINLSRFQKKYCAAHSESYSHKGRAKYWFTFKLSDYPDLFDFDLLKKHGMRSRDKSNIEGVVRDHKVSVAEAIKNNYDPYYIKHPLNCELLLNMDNAKKRATSSLSYEELVQLVNEYEK